MNRKEGIVVQYMGNLVFWNKRFEDRELKLMRHEKALEADKTFFPDKGSILDVACGDGRNSIYLAKLGYEVTSIDFSKEALKRLDYFANKNNLQVTTKIIDLSKEISLDMLGKYDAIVINHYRLNPFLYLEFMKHLNKKGILWVNGFREVPKDNPNISDVDVFLEEDFSYINSYILEKKELYEVEQSKFIRCIWRK